jgi:hypothetical protein
MAPTTWSGYPADGETAGPVAGGAPVAGLLASRGIGYMTLDDPCDGETTS